MHSVEMEALSTSNKLIGWVTVLFFFMQLLRNYKMWGIETWHPNAVWYENDSYFILIFMI